MEPEQPPLRAADSSPSPREEVVPGPQDPNSPTSTVAVPSSTPLPAIATPSVEVENTDSQVPAVTDAGGATQTLDTTQSPASGTESTPPTETAEADLNNEITKALAGEGTRQGADKGRLLMLCRVIDYWIADDTTPLIESLGLSNLASEIKRDYVLASLLAWRGEYKLSYIALRSFLESFCLLLYYFNQGCDRLLYLRGKGYKLMLHRMAQRKQEPDDTHAFRRHYELLLAEGDSEAFAKKFFDEMTGCYSLLSKAVHGDYSPKTGTTPEASFIALLERVLRVCNTLALHDLMLDATEDALEEALQGILSPIVFERSA